MARKQTKTQDLDTPEVSEPADDTKVTKAAAVRAALAAGKDMPEEGVAFIRDRFGIEIGKTHFSATKSQLKKKAEAGPRKPGRAAGRPRKEESAPGPSAEKAGRGEADLLSTLEALKPLLAQHGAEKLKRMVDLLD